MNEDEYLELHTFFKRHAAYVSVDLDFEQHTTAAHIISTPVEITVTFPSVGRFRRFTSELSKLEDIQYEEYIRQENPLVARAYEEYQILLKLSK